MIRNVLIFYIFRLLMQMYNILWISSILAYLYTSRYLWKTLNGCFLRIKILMFKSNIFIQFHTHEIMYSKMSIFWINLVPDISYITFPRGNFFQSRNETKELLQKPRNYSRNKGTTLETKELLQKPRNYSRNQGTPLETKELLQKPRNYSRNISQMYANCTLWEQC